MATGSPIGDCRRHAPTLTRGMTWRSVGSFDGHDEDKAVWPMTYGDDSCGEFASVPTGMGGPPPVEFKGPGRG